LEIYEIWGQQGNNQCLFESGTIKQQSNFENQRQLTEHQSLVIKTISLHEKKSEDFKLCQQRIDESIKLFSAIEDWHSAAYSFQSKGGL
jgi:hypothetical protein